MFSEEFLSKHEKNGVSQILRSLKPQQSDNQSKVRYRNPKAPTLKDSKFTMNAANPVNIHSSLMFNEMNSSVNLDSEDESRFDASRKNL